MIKGFLLLLILILALIVGFFSSKYDFIFLIILFFSFYISFIKLKFDPNKNFEKKCINFGCEFLLMYSKEKTKKVRYDKLLPILETWKICYYATFIAIYIGLISMLNTLFDANKQSFMVVYFLTYILWTINIFLINKVLLIEISLEYKSKFSTEPLVSFSNFLFAILISSINFRFLVLSKCKSIFRMAFLNNCIDTS